MTPSGVRRICPIVPSNHGKAGTVVVQFFERGERLLDVVNGSVELLLGVGKALADFPHAARPRVAAPPSASQTPSCNPDDRIPTSSATHHDRCRMLSRLLLARPGHSQTRPSQETCRSRSATAYRPEAARTRATEQFCVCHRMFSARHLQARSFDDRRRKRLFGRDLLRNK